MTGALVLGGGGVVGIAWETGVLKGLRDGGVDPATADLIIGASAGSVVGALLCGGRPLNDLDAEQFLPADGIDERTLGHDAVIVLAPIGASAQGIGGIARRQLDAEVEAWRAAGSTVEVILPDAASIEACGPNLMDTGRRAPAAEAGLRQGTETAARLQTFWAAPAGSATS